MIEIAPREFGHGRTRNLGAERATGERDRLPHAGRDARAGLARRAARGASRCPPDVGAVFGPHLPRPDTSPMIARELTEFFATFAPPDAAPRVFGPDDPTFLSNVNAAYRRACWEEIRFDDVAYSEDQAFGRALAAHPRWRKAYHPGAGVLHAHDYPPLEFMRRYFDEYRGLRETIGHVEPFGVRSTLRDVRALVAADRRYMREHGLGRRSARAGRRAPSCTTAGARRSRRSARAHTRCPPPCSARCRSRARAANGAAAHRRRRRRPADARRSCQSRRRSEEHLYEGIARALHDGPAPLLRALSRAWPTARACTSRS